MPLRRELLDSFEPAMLPVGCRDAGLLRLFRHPLAEDSDQQSTERASCERFDAEPVLLARSRMVNRAST